MQSATRTYGARTYQSLSRCTLCGHPLLAASALRRKLSTSPITGSGAPSSNTALRAPRWARSFPATHSGASPSIHTAARWARASVEASRRRTFATIVQVPTVAEDDLPEPLLSEGHELASNTLNVTEAAEKQLAKIQQRDNDPNLALRILVESGGCHGYSTKLQIADAQKDRAEDDYVLSAKSSASTATKTGLLLVDALTLSLIKGSTLDYATELIGSSFRLVDNPQASGKGCGCGVSWELKL